MDDGETLEMHLVSHWRQSGVIPEQLQVPPIPYEYTYIWDWWVTLHKTRPIGMDEGHITFTEILNWSTLLKINVTPFEVRCIMALDSAYITFRVEQQERKAASASK
jgi:hypothetical protein